LSSCSRSKHPGGRSPVNHLDIAVSQTSNPTSLWNIYRVDVTADGSLGLWAVPVPASAITRIGADAYGFYITTNSYPWEPGSFDGAQIYAFSSAACRRCERDDGAHRHPGMVNDVTVAQVQPGFTVWPAQSPGTGSYQLGAGGTGIS
jgi:hypothetical protein